MAREVSVWTVVVLLLVGVGITGAGDTNETLANTVRETEIAFAKTMADRDHAAFAAFLTAETVFLSGSTEFRGKDAVAAAWKPFFVGSNAPFSWQPETVSVLDSGTLGLSSGPVFDPEGNRIGTFASVWRREPDGSWKIVFDMGCPACQK